MMLVILTISSLNTPKTSSPRLRDGVYYTTYGSNHDYIYLIIKDNYYTYVDPVRFHAEMKGKITKASGKDDLYYLAEDTHGYYIRVWGGDYLILAPNLGISDVLVLYRMKGRM